MRVLYHFSLSPFCRKVRIVLGEKDLAFDLAVERYWERRHEFLSLNPAGQVPVLVEDGGPELIRIGSRNRGYHLEYIGYLAERRNYLAGGHFSLADVAAAAQLSCLDYLGEVAWEQYPAAKDWYARVKSRPSVRSILGDHIPGLPPPKHYANLDF